MLSILLILLHHKFFLSYYILKYSIDPALPWNILFILFYPEIVFLPCTILKYSSNPAPPWNILFILFYIEIAF